MAADNAEQDGDEDAATRIAVVWLKRVAVRGSQEGPAAPAAHAEPPP